MLFKECKFRDKKKVRQSMKEDILQLVIDDIPFSRCNEGNVLEYIDLLLDESEFDVRKQQFYYRFRWVNIPLNSNLFSKVASEYINEHLDDFLLEKHKN